MKFDTIITGGGLAGLTAGIALASKSQCVAIVSKGYSTLHFNSGSLGLLGFDAEHAEVIDRTKALAELPAEHPYSSLGSASVAKYEVEARRLLADAGLKFYNKENCNHHRLSPLGVSRPAWLTLDGMTVIEELKERGVNKIAVIGLAGYLDFSPRFYAAGLENEGFETKTVTIDTEALHRLRQSGTEMRAANIARSLTADDLGVLAEKIRGINADVDAVIMPAVVGLNGDGDWQLLRNKVRKPLYYATTLGVSVAGIIIERKLTRRFVELGGVIIKADAEAIDDCSATNNIIAAGRYFSHGLAMTPTATVAVGDIDVEAAAADRRYDADVFAAQPYMRDGVKTDKDFHVFKDGKIVKELFAAGSILSGANSLKEDSGAGVAMLTALHVSNKITE